MAYGERNDTIDGYAVFFDGMDGMANMAGFRRSSRRRKRTKKAHSNSHSSSKRHVRRRAKRANRSHSRRASGKVHYAKKTGQPYIILADGRAKFIKGRRRK